MKEQKCKKKKKNKQKLIKIHCSDRCSVSIPVFAKEGKNIKIKIIVMDIEGGKRMLNWAQDSSPDRSESINYFFFK